MRVKTLFIFAVIMVTLNAAYGQCTKQSKARSVFMTSKGSNNYVKAGEAMYAGIMVEDREGQPRVVDASDCEKLCESADKSFAKGDIIRSLNNLPVNSRKEWENALKQYKQGDKVQVGVERGSKMVTVNVVLEKIDVYKSVI